MWASPDTLRARGAVLDRHCETLGRDPASVARSVQAVVHVTDDESTARELVEALAPRPVVAGPPERFGEMVRAWADAGADEVVVPDRALGRGERRLEEMDALLAAGREAAD